jgi:hypothetical protein
MAQRGSCAAALRNASADSSYVNECSSATPFLKNFCAAAVHVTRNSTVPTDPFAPWDACFCLPAALPFGACKMQKAHSTTAIPLPVFFTIGLSRTVWLPLMVVPSVQGVNRAALRCIRPIDLLATPESQINGPQPCRTNSHRVDFSPAFAREVWHVPYRQMWTHSGPM